MFSTHLQKWHLEPDGEPVLTHSSRLLPVRWQGREAMLKVAMVPEEKTGCAVLHWWQGEGAARVFEIDDDAVLMERADGDRCLWDMAMNGHDDEASRILCRTASHLHRTRREPPPDLPGLDAWFRELWPAAETHGGILARCAAVARDLLASPRDVVVLHGDIHHENVLDFRERGWLAIDPKGIVGERGFDFANMLCNPDLPIASDPVRFRRQLDVIAEAGQLDRKRLLQWTLAFAGLSAAWFLSDGISPDSDLAVAHLADASLRQMAE